MAAIVIGDLIISRLSDLIINRIDRSLGRLIDRPASRVTPRVYRLDVFWISKHRGLLE